MSALDRRGFLSLAALGTAAVGLTGCAQARAEDDVRRSATYLPPAYEDLYPGIERFLDVASQASGGALTFEHFHSGSLIGAEQLMSGLLMNAADVVFMPSSYVTSSFPILGATQIPFVTNNYETQRNAMDPGGSLMDLINNELASKNVRALGGISCSFEYFWTVDAPIRKPEDVAGMRIRVSGEIEGVTVKALGGAPVFMSSSEIYQALERGTIDGVLCYVGTVFGRDLQQIVRYSTAAHFGAFTVDAYCRKDWYGSRPAHVRSALDTAGDALYRHGTANMLTVHDHKYWPAIKAAGVEIIEPTGAELAAFRKAVQPVYEHWRSLLNNDELASTVVKLIKKA